MFGRVVLAHRRRLGLTQEELAAKTGLSVRSIRDLESGRVRVPRQLSVRRLAEAFNLQGSDRERFHRDATGPPTPAAAPANSGGEQVRPAQLPAEVYGFTGRVAHLEQLDRLLAPVDGGAATAVVVAAIAGTAGVGKTALAVHWAHQVHERFPDGQLYVNLRGFDPSGSAMVPGDALQGFLDGLGVPPRSVPAGVEERAALYRSLLAGRRVLVVLDNARDAEQVRPLLPGAPGCMVVVTSRNQLTSLVAAEGAHPLALDLLTAGEARDLLVRRVGAARVAAEAAAVDDIVATCAGLPLALAIVAARAATHPTLGLAALAAELSEARGGLAAFAGDDAATDVRDVFSWSYRQLSPAAAKLFRLLGRHPGPDVGRRAVASLAGVPPEAIRPTLAELTHAHLVDEPTPGRYVFHDLLRAYANELADATDSPAELRTAAQRVLDHYLQTAHGADRLLDPHFYPIAIDPPQPRVTPERFAADEDALAWFTTEHRVLLAAIREAAEAGFDTESWQLACTMTHFLSRQGHWLDELASERIALDAAQRAGDRSGEAHLRRSFGGVHIHLGRFEEAHVHLRRALELFAELGDHTGQAHVSHTLSVALERQGRQDEALRASERALELYRVAGNRAGEARALNAVGWDYAQLGDAQRALEFCRQALALHREMGNRDGQAHTWDSLGNAHHRLGEYDQAIRCYEQALDIRRDLGDRYNEAHTLDCLGDISGEAGDRLAAREHWGRALDIFDQLGHPDADEVRVKLISSGR